MNTLIANRDLVRSLLPMHECIEIMADVLKTLALGRAVNPLRRGMLLPENRGVIGMMPAYLHEPPAMGIKVVSVLPANHGTIYDSHQGSVLLFDTEHGCLLGLMDASSITAIRTAAVSGVATRLLSRQDARTLAILGSGVQAASHLEAMKQVRDLDAIRIWSRAPERAGEFAEKAAGQTPQTIKVCASVEEAVDRADIICTTTSSPVPILMGSWLSPGAHINAVGSSVKFTRELDTDAVVRSRLFVDRRESTINEAGDFLFPRNEGAIDENHIQAELGEILAGTAGGRRGDEEITLFKSLGLGVEDVASAYHIYQKALRSGAGVWVDWGGTRD